MFTDYLTFTEWYHYVLLFLWLIILLTGIKYFNLLESAFKANEDFTMGEKYGKNMLLAAFVIGLLMVLIWTFKPAQTVDQTDNWNYAKYIFYGLFIALLALNAFISLRNYKSKSKVLRIVIMSILMVLYFYSGMLGGLMIFAFVCLFVIIYAFIKLKKILTIR